MPFSTHTLCTTLIGIPTVLECKQSVLIYTYILGKKQGTDEGHDIKKNLKEEREPHSETKKEKMGVGERGRQRDIDR